MEAREGSERGRVLASATSQADGTFEILGIPAGSTIWLEVPEQPLYLDGLGYDQGTQVCADQVVPFGYELLVYRYITGLNYEDGDTIRQGATISWDPVPGVTSYCVAMSPGPVGYAESVCPWLSNPGYVIGSATSVTIPSVPSGTKVFFSLEGYHPKVSGPITELRGDCCVFTIR